MEEKIEVGEFVRTVDGKFGIFDRYSSRKEDSIYKSPFNCFVKLQNRKTPLQCHRSYIVKHSKNIFKLLESEDIVILEYYVSKYRKRIKRKFEIFKARNLIRFDNIHCDFLYDLNEQKFLDGKGFNVKIKGIVSKEQFEQVKFEV